MGLNLCFYQLLLDSYLLFLSHCFLIYKMGVGWFKWYSGCKIWVLINGSTTCPGLLVPLSPGEWLGSADTEHITGIECTCTSPTCITSTVATVGLLPVTNARLVTQQRMQDVFVGTWLLGILTTLRVCTLCFVSEAKCFIWVCTYVKFLAGMDWVLTLLHSFRKLTSQQPINIFVYVQCFLCLF